MKNIILYSSDVNLEDHASTIFYKDIETGKTEGLFIERYEDQNKILVYNLEIFNRANDSWLSSKEDLSSLNNCCDTNYKFNKKFETWEAMRFSEDLCHYHGALNFDTYPLSFKYKKFLKFLKNRNLIE